METQTVNNSDQKQQPLTHREAKLVLERIDLDTHKGELEATEQAAIDHYMPTVHESDKLLGFAYDCEICAQKGFNELLGISLNCKEAIEVFAQLLPLETIYLMTISSEWPGWRAETLRQLLAFEHIWGRPNYNAPSREWPGACGSDACYEVTKICVKAGRGDIYASRFNGSDRTVLSQLIELFDQKEWSLDELFQLQRQRAKKILGAAEDITLDEKREGRRFISCLQGLKTEGSN